MNNPRISFGLGETVKTVAVDAPVVIYQHEIYRAAEVTFSINEDTKSNIYLNTLTFDTPGVYTIQAKILVKILNRIMTSNRLTLTVE